MVSPQAKREAVGILTAERSLGVTRACGLVGISRSLYRYRSRRSPALELRNRIAELAAQKRRYGYRRIQVLLRREGWSVNHKRTYRLYREQGLMVRKRKRKRIGLTERQPLPMPSGPNQSWSMDYVADGLVDGRKLRVLWRSWTTTAANALRSRSTRRFPERALWRCLSAWPISAAAALNHRGSRSRIRGSGARCLGIQASGSSCLHPSWETGRERLCRELQWAISR